MSLDTYTGLVAEVGNWLDRPDLAARVPTFIRLVESKVNRRLSDPDMEQVSTSTASSDYTALPDGFGEMVSISTGDLPLAPMSAVEYAGIDSAITGRPRFYIIVDGAIGFYPRDATAAIRIVYRKNVPALTSSNATNWLLTRAPDVYLYGALTEASAFLVEDDRAGSWKALFDQAMAELMIDADRRRWGVGPLAPRIRRT